MSYDWKTDIPGITSRHADQCPIGDGQECTCGPEGFRASTRDRFGNRSMASPTFGTVLEALMWQRDQVASHNEPQSAAARTVVGALIVDFLQAAGAGMAPDAHGQRYGPESLHALRGALSYVDSEFGAMAADEVRRYHVQGLVDQLRGAGVDGTRITAVVDALNQLYSYAIRRGVVGFSPVVELDLPVAGTGMPYVAAQTPPNFPSTNGHWMSPVPQTPWEPNGPYGQWPDPRASQLLQTAAPGGFNPADQPGASGYSSGGFMPPQTAPPPAGINGTGSGFFSGPFDTPRSAPDANYDATMQERWLWWTVRIIVIVFVLIALVLAAESV